MIEAVDLSKRYPNGHLALDALNLQVEAGEIYCLLGAQGSGKTTAINLFLGFTEPTAGWAWIGGVDVAQEPLRAKARTAYLADTTAFYRRLTALENLGFFARLGGRRAPTRHDCEMALREVGLPEAAFTQRMGGFSLGLGRKGGHRGGADEGGPGVAARPAAPGARSEVRRRAGRAAGVR